jgi:hypothetical protein
MTTITTACLADRPDLLDHLPFGPGWPKFIFHDSVAARLMPTVDRVFVQFNLVLLDEDDAVVAGGWGVPLCWDGSVEGLPRGWDGALERAVAEHENGTPSTTLCAMATEVTVDHQHRGLAGKVLAALHQQAHAHGLGSMIAPARPTLKYRYPLIPIERYAKWMRDDGSPFDPWLRSHWRLGARVLATTEHAMEITGTVADWEDWIGMALPETGNYVIPEGLTPVTVDREADTVRYVEPAVWMLHPPKHAPSSPV